MNMKKKLLSLVLVVAMCASISTSVFASEGTDIVEKNAGITRASIHESSRTTNSDGTQAWTDASVFDGTSVYYLKASIQAYSNHGNVKGAYNDNDSKYNQSSVTSGKVTEKNSNRYYYSRSECKETSSSSTEVRDGKTDTF